ncbi:MAG: FxsA family protein [Phycisphaerae bacterium]|nr:FxsA family protein [Phycisphaerae bacterium]
MFLKLLLLFTLIPLLELALLIKIGGAIHVGPTIALIVLSGVVGAALARHQGFKTMARIQESLARGVMPTKEMVDGLMILVAAVVLITPGVITDAFGFVLLIPPARARVRKAVTNYIKKRIVLIQPPQDSASPVDDGFIDVEAHSSNRTRAFSGDPKGSGENGEN